MIRPTMAVFAVLVAPLAAQQPPASTPAPAAVQGASLRDALGAALRAPMYGQTSDALRKEHGDVSVLEALLDEIERCPACPEGSLARSQAFHLLLELVADGAADAEHAARIGKLLPAALLDPDVRRDAATTTLHLPADEQRATVGAMLPHLDDRDLEFVAEVCRVLGRLGPAAESALPQLEELVRRADAPAASSGKAGRVREQAAEARILISGEVAVDAALYPTLDAAGQDAAAWPIAKLLGQMGVPRGQEDEPRRALAGYYLDWLGRTHFPDPKPEAMRSTLALPRLVFDDTDDAIRVRARALLERWASGDDAKLAALARHVLEPPEVPYDVEESPAADARVEALFRPASALLTARATPRGLLAVSVCERNLQPTAFPPTASMLFVWDVGTRELLRCVDGVHGDVVSAVLAPDGSFVVAGTQQSVPRRPADGLVVVPLDGEGAPRVLPGHEAGASGLDLFEDGGRVASVGGDRVVRVTDVAAGAVLREWSMDGEATPLCLAIRGDGRRLFVGGSDLSLQVYDVASGDRVASGTTRDESRPVPAEEAEFFTGDPRAPAAAAFLADGERLLVGDFLGRLAVWDPRSDRPPVALAETGSPVAAIALSPDGGRAAAGLAGTWKNRGLRRPSNFSIPIREIATGAPVTTLTGMWMAPGVIEFLPDGERVLGMSRSALRVWRLEPR